MLNCNICNYETYRKSNFDRHLLSNKHKKQLDKVSLEQLQKEAERLNEENLKILEEKHKILERKQKQIQDKIIELKKGNLIEGHNEDQSSQYNETDDECNTSQVLYVCEKCKAAYKTSKYFQAHSKKCCGVDSHTCPTCMKTFTDYSNKRRHIQRKACKPVSVFHHIDKKLKKEKNINISNSTVNNHNTYNTTNTTNNNHFNTNIYINNYGQERTDYITYDVFYKIVDGKAYHIIPEYFRVKHLHPNFPENHNIRRRNNQFFIKQNGIWNKITKDNLSNRIFNNCGSEVYCTREKYKERIKNEPGVSKEKMKDIIDLTNYVKMEEENKDAVIKQEIINLIDGTDIPSEYVLNAGNYYEQSI